MRPRSALHDLFSGIGGAWHRARLAARPATRRFHALRGPVEVVTDTFGVPHVFADHLEDLFFAQGFVTARDRLFQMDYNRHGARGRLCELVGKVPLPWRKLTVHLKDRTTLDVDVMLRTFGLEQAAEAQLRVLSGEARQVLASYGAGVNAYLATRPRTLEHRILGLPPAPWTELDSLVMLKAIAFELNFAWRSVLLGGMLLDRGVSPALAPFFGPRYPEGASTIVGEDVAALSRGLAATRAAADAAIGLGNAPGVGSNSWAVAGSHTASGHALLANDTHLNLIAPVPWHEVHLETPELKLQGFALAGLPGIGIGRNGSLAWGITAGLVHDLDLFVERLDPADPTRVLTPRGYEPMTGREEVFKIRGQGHERRTIWSSAHGPLLETVGEPPANHRLAIAWTGHHVAPEFDGLMDLWRAKSIDDGARALERHVCPTFNITLADATGRVGYVLAGGIPKRRPGTPLRPLEGWTGQWDWQGLVPADENPRELDPARGFVVTANNRVAPWGYRHDLGVLFEPPERFDRINQRLRELGAHVTVEDMADVQRDVLSHWSLDARATLLGLVGGVDGLAPERQSLQRVAAELWAAWDGEARSDSAGAAVGFAVTHFAGGEVVRRLAGDDAAHGYLEMSSFIGPSIVNLAARASALREAGVEVADCVRHAFERAVEFCCQRLGEDPTQWTWGALHPLVVRHRFHDTPLGGLFSIGPIPAPGGPDTVNRGDVNAANDFDLKIGPAMRMVADAGDPSFLATIVPGGNSGDRLSPHYDDQVLDFVAGRLKRVSSARAQLATEARERFLPEGRAVVATEEH